MVCLPEGGKVVCHRRVLYIVCAGDMVCTREGVMFRLFEGGC